MDQRKKQAVVLVHGIGEQRPMQTVREFVKSIWVKDTELSNTRFWNKPSEVSESFEHRRLTTDYAKIKHSSASKTTSRVDFYEYYWAHHTVGTTMEHLKSWLFTLLARRPAEFPKALQPLIFLVWGLIFAISFITFLILIGSTTGAESQQLEYMSWAHVKSIIYIMIKPLLLAILAWVLWKVVRYLGDVARYITASPSNIKVRQAIRDGGVTLLESIVATGNYDRIVLVGHSLGSVIAYDILSQYWARSNKFKNQNGKGLALTAEALNIIHQMESMDNQPNAQQYRSLQNQLFNQLQIDCAMADKAKLKHTPWLISDLITLGSPLTYADFLLFESKHEFNDRKLDRQYPTSPPVKENEHYYYQTDKDKYLHHGAVFSLVRWTNIYSKAFKIFGGDLVSGPVSRAFANPQITATSQQSEAQPDTPIMDINVQAAYPGRYPRLFTHTHYWRWHTEFESACPDHITALREAINLKGHIGVTKLNQ
ncbi:hypothetical protein [Aliiglaciecola sp. LCG003]|uniref:hypothetical protein n=1 Tax=Aliiglaciecola sp. LCG003 TaxID=3053655 RepID=UPI002572FCB0|nr:hypothetical protein [Aliiglaciecola sp. LCG003]WJG09092.1 hypothetical protein QR722_17460 [Aliiglaciecola sp. LCG003]